MRRGDIVTIALQGDHGKPRPALIIQGDVFAALPMVAVLPLSSMLLDATLTRIDVVPNAQNGLRASSQIVVHRVVTAPRAKVGPVIGHVDDATMVEVNRALAVFLGLG